MTMGLTSLIQALLLTLVRVPFAFSHYYIDQILGTSLIALPVDVAEMLNTQIGDKKSSNGRQLVPKYPYDAIEQSATALCSGDMCYCQST